MSSISARESGVNNPAESGSSSPAFYPRNKSVIRSQELRVRGFKCGCGSVWCPACFKKRSQKEISGRLNSFNYRSTRHIVLTVRRDLFRDGKDATEFIRKHKVVANMVHNLRRSGDVHVIDWVWVREWHREGWPHFHLFVEVDKEGAAGMITGGLLRKYWSLGRIHEGYISNRNHWLNLVGYFGKKGYFEKGKGCQAELPEWAVKENTGTIRRFGAMNLQKIDEGKKMVNHNEFAKDLIEKTKRTYEVVLESCGKRTWVKVGRDDGGFVLEMGVDVPYIEFKKILNGAWVAGFGLVKMMSCLELAEFLNSRDELKKIWWALQEVEGFCGEYISERG